MLPLLADFLSRDTSRVLRATWETIGSRDPAMLDALVPHIAQIRRATQGLAVGGILRSNEANVQHALTKLTNYQRGRCWCENYPDLPLYDPQKERDAGHIRIVSTSEPGWSMTYACECAVCDRGFTVEQSDHHYTRWTWVPRGQKRRRPR